MNKVDGEKYVSLRDVEAVLSIYLNEIKALGKNKAKTENGKLMIKGMEELLKGLSEAFEKIFLERE